MVAISKRHAKHIETLNREMGEVKTELSWIKKEIKELKKDLSGLKRLIYGSIIVPILLFVLQKWLGG